MLYKDNKEKFKSSKKNKKIINRIKYILVSFTVNILFVNILVYFFKKRFINLKLFIIQTDFCDMYRN